MREELLLIRKWAQEINDNLSLPIAHTNSSMIIAQLDEIVSRLDEDESELPPARECCTDGIWRRYGRDNDGYMWWQCTSCGTLLIGTD